MPKYYEGKEESGRPCSGFREDLQSCLLESDCVLKEGKSPKQCLKEGHCRSLQISFFECKRSTVCCQICWGFHPRPVPVGRSICPSIAAFTSCAWYFELDSRSRFRGRKGY